MGNAPKRDVTGRIYPETRAGGFPRNSNQVLFFSRVRALLGEGMSVLDFGAGSGKWQRLPPGFRKDLICLRGHCRRVIGVDVDEAVLKNPLLDEAHVVHPEDRLPFGDQSFDMIVSWAVLEHVADPRFVAGEFARLLKPGGVDLRDDTEQMGVRWDRRKADPQQVSSLSCNAILSANVDAARGGCVSHIVQDEYHASNQKPLSRRPLFALFVCALRSTGISRREPGSRQTVDALRNTASRVLRALPACLSEET